MKFSKCPLCAYPHNPEKQCPPGRRRSYEIPFPAWVKVSQCELRSETRYFATGHGRQKFVTRTLTPHGHTMHAFRQRDAFATVDQATVIHRSRVRA